jgi:ribonuclease P/MRP protein subunit POP5
VVVKDRVGRNRYVAFRLEGGEGATRGEMEGALREAARGLPVEARPELLRFAEGKGIVRCGHRHRDAVVEALRTIRSVGRQGARVETLGTSGTIRKAVEKYLG